MKSSTPKDAIEITVYTPCNESRDRKITKILKEKRGKK